MTSVTISKYIHNDDKYIKTHIRAIKYNVRHKYYKESYTYLSEIGFLLWYCAMFFRLKTPLANINNFTL